MIHRLTIRSRYALLVALAGGLVLSGGSPSRGIEIPVSSAFDISVAMQTAQPGDVLVMQNGTWTNQQIQFAGDGAAGAPITLRAETPGQVILNGSSSLNISGDYLVADGLNFDGGALGASDHIVEFRGSNGEATNSRLTNSAIVDYNPASIDTRYFWVSLYGQNNRVDNNFFSGQNHSGVTVTVWRDSADADYHQIDNNYFADRPEGNGNGFETIRIGTSAESLSDSFTVVESNLFERTDGEAEIISNKSGNNIFRYNTFREAAGTLTLRHGNNNLVEGNFFLGNGKDETGGVRVIGENQTVVNNYFEGLDGRAGGAISISAGVANSELNEYIQVDNAVIAHNTIVDVKEAAITFDDGLGSSDRTLLAQNVTIANNAIDSSQDPLFEGNIGTGWTWAGNVAHGQSLGDASGVGGISTADPLFGLAADGLQRPQANSPLIDSAVLAFSSGVTDDMDGDPRLGAFDIGADEVTTNAPIRGPLTPDQVGPSWLNGDPVDPVDPPSLGCSPLAIQAESFSLVLDPDNNGAIWSAVSDSSALGGEVLKAPNENRARIEEGEDHETIAVYNIVFDEPGTYQAYYLARGFNGSSDSFFTPTDFGVDPTIVESLSQTGFNWEPNGTGFVVNASDVGVPLEFRIGMREGNAEIDAFVLSMDSSLSDAELNALFDILAGDYNNDGMVDTADYTVWRNSFGSTDLGHAADGDCDGDVDAEDYLIWRANFGQTQSAVASQAAVPEPTSALLTLFALAIRRRRRPHRTAAHCR